MSTQKLTLDAFRDVPPEIQTPQRTVPRARDIDWDSLAPAVRRVSEFEALTGHQGVFTEKQHKDTTRVHEAGLNAELQRATADGHDYSDMGGGDQ